MKALVPNNYRNFLEFKFGKGVIENWRYPNSRRVQVLAVYFVYFMNCSQLERKGNA